jgi:hypothetical protein
MYSCCSCQAQYSWKSPLLWTARSVSTASASSSPHLAPVMSMRSAIIYCDEPGERRTLLTSGFLPQRHVSAVLRLTPQLCTRPAPPASYSVSSRTWSRYGRSPTQCRSTRAAASRGSIRAHRRHDGLGSGRVGLAAAPPDTPGPRSARRAPARMAWQALLPWCKQDICAQFGIFSGICAGPHKGVGRSSPSRSR